MLPCLLHILSSLILSVKVADGNFSDTDSWLSLLNIYPNLVCIITLNIFHYYLQHLNTFLNRRFQLAEFSEIPEETLLENGGHYCTSALQLHVETRKQAATVPATPVPGLNINIFRK